MSIRFRLVLALLFLSNCTSGAVYVSPTGHFQVTMPGQPTLETKVTDSPVGRVNVIWAKSEDRNIKYGVAYVDFPADIVKRAGVKNILQGFQQQEASTTKGKIIDVNWDEDLLGMRFIMFQEQGDSAGYYYAMRGNRFYQLRIEGPIAEVHGDGALSFLTSLRLQ